MDETAVFGYKIGVAILALAVSYGVYRAVKCFLEECLGRIMGCLCCACCLPGIAFLIGSTSPPLLVKVMVYLPLITALGMILGCIVGNRLAKIIIGMQTSFMGSCMISFGLFAMTFNIWIFTLWLPMFITGWVVQCTDRDVMLLEKMGLGERIIS